jgi:hypothetical protein
MRAAIALLVLVLLAPVHAVEWRSEEFNCSANLPGSPGWLGIEVPPIPGITVLVAIRHPARQALFGINVLDRLPGANLNDPPVRQAIENLLRQFAYQFVGHSTVRIGAFDWLQYPVRAGSGPQQVSGVIRFTSANGQIFGLTLLRGGGQDASQDAELQQTAASFRVGPVDAAPAVAVATPPRPPGKAPAPALTAFPSGQPGGKKATEADASAEPESGYGRWIVPGGLGLIFLIVLMKIIGGSGAKGGKKLR